MLVVGVVVGPWDVVETVGVGVVLLVVGVVVGPWDVVETVGVGVVVLVVGVFTDPDTLGVLVLVLDFVEYEVDFLLE